MRGWFAVGIEAGKTPENLGGLWRSAHAFGGAWLFTIGCRYPRRTQPPDTSKAARHVPLLQFGEATDLVDALPPDAALVAVECGDDIGRKTELLPAFEHPERAVYVLGAEDRGLSAGLVEAADRVVEIPSRFCLNVATAGSVVMYDRIAKEQR